MRESGLFVIIVIITALTSAKAQKPVINSDGTVTINKENVKFTLMPFARNVVKVIMQPDDYLTNELISDAVIAKRGKVAVNVAPSTRSNYRLTLGEVQLELKDDTLYFGDHPNALISADYNSGSYRGFRFLLTPDEKIFGGGERALPLNRRGYKLELYNQPSFGYGVGATNLNYSVPFITSSNNYALFFDNPSKAYLDIGKNNSSILEYGAYSGELNFYLIKGNSYSEILSTYHSLTGTQPIPPRWVFGNFLSRFGYTSEAEVKSIMQKMKDSKIPYDAVIFDLFWFGDSVRNTLGNLEWVNKKAWPNPQKMITDFKDEGTKTVLITEPYVVITSSNYSVSKNFHAVDSSGNPYLIKEFYFGPGGLIDIFRNDSKDWFWSKYKSQMNKGVEGWWGDLGEPETHPAKLYHNLKDLGFKRLFKADEVHNVYGHYWTKMLFEKFALEYPDKRLFSLNRSGFAGTQRFGIFPWTGDVSRSWSGLQAQLPVFLGMSMSGVPYVHSDAGGFGGGEKDPELYIRWLQFARFTPVFKPHGTELTLIDTTVSNYPSEPALIDEPYRSLAKKVVEDRYSLLPYNYTLAYQQSITGKPLISPLYYFFSNDTTTYNVQDEFFWGENLLVAPVLNKGAITRPLYLPPGIWYNYKTSSSRRGGRWITDSVTMEDIPVYVKEGSFIPTFNKSVMNTTAYNTERLTVTYFPSKNSSSYTLFDDDGTTNKSLQKKQYELLQFTSTGWSKQMTIAIKSNHGSFTGKPSKRAISFAVSGLQKMPSLVTINGNAVSTKKSSNSYVGWNEQLNTMTINFTFTGASVVLKVQE